MEIEGDRGWTEGHIDRGGERQERKGVGNREAGRKGRKHGGEGMMGDCCAAFHLQLAHRFDLSDLTLPLAC